MSNREALVAALDSAWSERTMREQERLDAAVLKHIAQLPEKCGTCGGSGLVPDASDVEYLPDPICHGKGVVYPPALVERIARLLYDSRWGAKSWDADNPAGFVLDELQTLASAVLDALNAETAETN